MVSTRQMSTTASNATPGEDTCTRITVTTRQSSHALSTLASSSKSSSLGCTTVALPSTSSSSRNNDGEGAEVRQSVSQKVPLSLFDMPMEILSKIFSYVGYKKVCHLRVVSPQMNQICIAILNSTFSKLQIQMLLRFQTVKAKMPRRESARRNHPLACECDIIETCYMRLSLLQMTFGKHIERKHCCFFPGGILDEVYNVLNYIRTTPKVERPFKVTDELFDLSTMAMEYFKEYIEPYLPEIAYFTKSKQTSYSLKTTSELTDNSSQMPSPPQSNMVLRKGIRKIKQGMKMYNNQLTVLRNELRTCKRKSSEQGKQIADQQKLLADQQKQTLEYANRLDENDKKNEEMSRKFSTLLQELNKCKTELQYWRSKSPATQICTSCGQKIAPVAPEDFQALVNQGVNPADINLSIDDADENEMSNTKDNDYEVDDGDNTIDKLETATNNSSKSAIKFVGSTLKRRHEDSNNDRVISSTITSNSAGSDIFSLMFNNSNSDLNAVGSLQTNLTQCGLTNLFGYKNISIDEERSGTNGNNVGLVVSPSTSSGIVNDFTSLNSSDIKKARRVQNKGSRCHNVSSKRSK